MGASPSSSTSLNSAGAPLLLLLRFRRQLQDLLAILSGSRELREFSVQGYVGFNENDEEVRKRAAGSWRVKVAGSRMVDELADEFTDGNG
jgi:hypothetical protein